MKAKAGFFQDGNGNNSSSRLLGFIVITYALALTTAIITLGHMEGSTVIVTAAAAGTTFTTIAGPAMLFMFNNKKTEKQETSTDAPITDSV